MPRIQGKKVPNSADVLNLTLSVRFGNKYEDQRFSNFPCAYCNYQFKKMSYKLYEAKTTTTNNTIYFFSKTKTVSDRPFSIKTISFSKQFKVFLFCTFHEFHAILDAFWNINQSLKQSIIKKIQQFRTKIIFIIYWITWIFENIFIF